MGGVRGEVERMWMGNARKDQTGGADVVQDLWLGGPAGGARSPLLIGASGGSATRHLDSHVAVVDSVG